MASRPARGEIIDTVSFGDTSSETAHAFAGNRTDTTKGGLDETCRRLLPPPSADWQGGRMSFTMKTDPAKLNYFTVRLWGSDSNIDRLILFCEGKQVGYRHLGDIDTLDIGDHSPAYNGRFFYRTTPLPIEMSRGKSELHFEIRSSGGIWGYGGTWEIYQKPMTDPTRGIYRVYTHNAGFFAPPETEKQGEAPANAPVRTAPGEELLDKLKDRVRGEIESELHSKSPLSQVQMQFLAHAWRVKWTPAYHNQKVVEAVTRGVDEYFRAFRKDPKLAESDPRQVNADWQGLGSAGDAVRLLAAPLLPALDEMIDDGAGQTVPRRAAWSQMLQASRDSHLRHRPQYTNQGMITDLNSYLANRGVAAIDPSKAMPEETIRHYLYQAVGIEPWLGSDTDSGPQKPLGDSYYQLTRKGLTRELGYVGYYGEVLDWVTHIYNATADPDKPRSGDPKIRDQLVKMEGARSHFRYPTVDDDGNRAMRIETIVGWRDLYYPGDVTYAERSSWEGSALYASAATLDPVSIQFDQQMCSDHQFFSSVDDLMKQGGLRVTKTLLGVPDQYEQLRGLPAGPGRLPMTTGQPDTAFADEEDGVVALKHGEEILYASLYWRARYAINFLARVHYLTPKFDRVAVVEEQTIFEPSGLEYTRPDWVNFGFGNGGIRYPGDLHSSEAGEKLPIAKIPAGTRFKPGDESPYAGRGSFYRLLYGKYLIGMNTTTDKTFDLEVPAGLARAPDLISGNIVAVSGGVKVPPRSTIVLLLPE